MKIANPFRFGLMLGLGLLLALVIGLSIQSLATILTYIGAALFLALGIDPAVSWLQRRRLPRPLAVLVVFAAILAVFAGLVLAIIPVITDQVQKFVAQWPKIVDAFQSGGSIEQWVKSTLPWLPLDSLVSKATDWFNSNVAGLSGGVLNTTLNIANGVFGVVIVLILTLYFVASLKTMKQALYRLVPASKRTRFADLAEQIGDSVGRYVMGQVTLGLVNGVLSFFWLTFGIQASYSALLAFIAFLGSLIPLVGTISGSIVISLLVLLFNGWFSALMTLLIYLVYMQIEAYVLSPNIMNRAVKVPGVVVVIAALAGGTLLGILGALVAIPVAAAVLLIVNQVLIPRQNQL